MDAPAQARAALERWIASGGHWAVVAERGDHVTVGLLTCDGGQEMDRIDLPVGDLPEDPGLSSR